MFKVFLYNAQKYVYMALTILLDFIIVFFLILVVKNITLEPVMLFLSFVSSMDRVPVGELLVYKSCQQDFNFTSDVCENIHNDTYDPELTQIQNEVAQYKVNNHSIV